MIAMWECKYGKEPLNIRLFVLLLLKKLPVLLAAGLLGAILAGGSYFLVKVTFGPAKEYEAVTDFYIDYALQADGTPHTYINFATWDQLLKDDVFTDKILTHMSGVDAAEFLDEAEKAAKITKGELRGYLSATVLSDWRIATTTVRTEDPKLTMGIEKALVQAMFDFGEQQKEIAEIRILQEPQQATLVIADVRTFRACMTGAVSFVFVVALYLCLYYALDEGIRIPETFERRYGIPMLGTVCSKELPVLAKKLLTGKPALLAADKGVDPEQVQSALRNRGIETEGNFRVAELFGQAETADDSEPVKRIGELADREILLLVKAGAHNGKQIEKTLDFCRKCGLDVAAALLWEADEKLIRAYEMPEHVFRAWPRSAE